MANLDLTIGGVSLILQKTTDLVEVTTPNESDVVTLGGTLYTDFVNMRRNWRIHLVNLCQEDYDDLRDVRDAQYPGGGYPAFVFPYFGINTVAKLTISDRSLRQDGINVPSLDITLAEQYAVS